MLTPITETFVVTKTLRKGTACRCCGQLILPTDEVVGAKPTNNGIRYYHKNCFNSLGKGAKNAITSSFNENEQSITRKPFDFVVMGLGSDRTYYNDYEFESDGRANKTVVRWIKRDNRNSHTVGKMIPTLVAHGCKCIAIVDGESHIVHSADELQSLVIR